jgi:hypothetical protein
MTAWFETISLKFPEMSLKSRRRICNFEAFKSAFRD